MSRRLLDAGYTAGMTLIKNRVVALVNGVLYHYNPLDSTHYGKIIGFSKDNYSMGEDDVIVIRDGYIDITANPLIQGAIYYATTAGSITSTIPIVEPVVQVGIAKDTTELVIQINDSYNPIASSSLDINLVIALAVAL